MKTSNFKFNNIAIGIQGTDYSFGINQLLSLRYNESIKSASVRAEIQLTDTETGALSDVQGMEPVFIDFEDHLGTKFKMDLVVYDVQDRLVVDGKSKATLLCCNPDLINNAAAKISRRFGGGGGKAINEMVETDVLEKILGSGRKVVHSEPTKNKFSFISCYWSPFTIIKWLATKAIPAGKSGANASAGYAFFENAKGYNFSSYDHFANKKFTKKMIVGYSEPEMGEPDKTIIPIVSMRVTHAGDVLTGLNLGSYSSKFMTFDVQDMSYTEHSFNISKYYKDVPKMNGDVDLPTYFKKFEKTTAPTRIMSKIMDTALFTEGTMTQDSTKQVAQSALREKLFYSKEVQVEYVGDIDLFVGDTIELTVYKGKKKDLDGSNSGVYVVGEIEREFISSNDQMTTKATLYTDSPGNIRETSQTKTDETLK